MGLLSLSAGVMVTYAGYLSEKSNLVTSTAWVAVLASNVGMPLSAMGFLIAAAWVAWKKHTVRQL